MKAISRILALLLLVAGGFVTQSFAEDTFTVGGYNYTVISNENKTVRLETRNDVVYSGDIVVPDKVTYGFTYTVTELGDYAFNGNSNGNQVDGITSITIPEGVTYLAGHVMRNLPNLTTINLPASLEGTGWYAFVNNTKLENITVASGSTHFKAVDGVLFNADRTHLVVYPAGRAMESYTIPSTVTSLARQAFDHAKIQQVTLPGGLTEIPGGCFTHSDLTSITIPGNVKNIGGDAFNGCSSLTSITLQEGIETLGWDIIAWTPIESINLPASLYGASTAFVSASKLKTIQVAEGSNTFKSVDGVLYSNNGITLMSYPADKEGTVYEVPAGTRYIPAFGFAYNKNLTNVILPEGLTTIDYNVFYGTDLSKLVLPSTVSWVGNIFNSSIKDFYFTSKNAPMFSIGDGDYVPSDKVIHVPHGSKSAYVAACARLETQLNDNLPAVGSSFVVDGYAYTLDDWYKDADGNATVTVKPDGGVNATLSSEARAVIYFDQPLIKSANQLSSPFTRAAEGAISNLIDNNYETIWHSEWNAGAVAHGTHYLVVKVDEGLTDGLAIRLSRRTNHTQYHPTKFKVFGATAEGYNPAEDDGTAGTWTELGDINVPYTSQYETVASSLLPFQGKYTYFKFLCTENVDANEDQGFWHASEFQLFKGVTVPADGVVIRPSVTYLGNTYQVARIGTEAFYGSNLKSISIPEGIKRLDYRSIYGSDELTSLTLPATLEQMDPYAITWNKKLTTITVAEGSNYYKTVDNVLFSKDGKRLYVYPGGKEGVHYDIPNGTEYLNGDAFAANEYLREVAIPETVVGLDAFILSGSSVTSLILPTTLERMDRECFKNAQKLTAVVFQAYNPPSWAETALSADELNAIVKFHVPKGRRDAYLAKWAATGIDSERVIEGGLQPGASFAENGIKYTVLPNGTDVWATNASDERQITDAVGLPTEVTFASWTYNVRCYATVDKEEGYLLNKARGMYLMRGWIYNTHSALSRHGAEFTLVNLYDNVYAIDSHIGWEGNTYVFLNNENHIYLDGTMTGFTRTTTEDGYYAFSLLVGDDNHTAYLTGDPDYNIVNMYDMETPSDNALWKLVTKSERQTEMAAATISSPQDATFLIADPDFGIADQRFGQWNKDYIDGQSIANEVDDNGPEPKNGVMDSWFTKFDFYQVLTDIPNGTYRLTAQGFFREYTSNYATPFFYANEEKCDIVNISSEGQAEQTDIFDNERDGVYIFSSVGKAAIAFSQGYYQKHELVVTVTDGTLRIGVKSEDKSNWIAWDNFELTFLGEGTPASLAQTVNGNTTQCRLYADRDYVLEDNAERLSVTGSDQQVKTLTYHRNFSNTEWQSLYVPFTMNYEDWSADFDIARLNNINQYDTNNDGVADLTILEIFPITSGSIKPNYPYLIRAKEAGEKNIVLSGATLSPTASTTIDCSSITTLYTFTGIYQKVSGADMYNNGYYALGGGSLRQTSSADNSLNAFRWYMAVTDREGATSNVKEVRISVYGEGDTTGMKLIDSTDPQAPCYDLTGRRISKPARGLYIQNGKKFVNR